MRTFWRAPDGQPRWSRPVLLAIATLSGLMYGWALSSDPVEPLYGAAARSMSLNWSNFFFGSFDPAGTVTIDKLPGELWIQAAVLRATGIHIWAIVLPQVIEGAIAILVLYRAVNRLSGPAAAMVAAICLSASPITVLLNRGNISDTLLILLLLLGADALSKAIATGQTKSLLVAGIWVGLAFQTKMLEAWIVIPAFAFAYFYANKAINKKRWSALVRFALVAIVVSLSWMTVVTAIPAHDRPYVDASRNNSEFEQVFYYNGIDRTGIAGLKKATIGTEAPYLLRDASRSLNYGTAHLPRSWDRLLWGPLGLDDGWLMPAAALALLAMFLGRRRLFSSRKQIAGVILWGAWLIWFFVFFSAGSRVNSYYLAALCPPLAALCGIGFSVARRHLADLPSIRVWLAGAVTMTSVYVVFVLPPDAAQRHWIIPGSIAVALAADVALLVRSYGDIGTKIALSLSLLSVVCVPIATSIVVVTQGLGPFDYPYEPASVRELTQVLPRLNFLGDEDESSEFGQLFPKPNSVVATETSAIAATRILVSGREFLPIGGYLGAGPEPSLAKIKSLVANGQLAYVDAAIVPANPDPRFVWIRQHCTTGATPPSSTATTATEFGIYVCGTAHSSHP